MNVRVAKKNVWVESMISPPTDSLYKFIAISGLVLVIWGVTFPENKRYELAVESEKIIARIANHDDLEKLYETRAKALSLVIAKLVQHTDYENENSSLHKQVIDTRRELHELAVKQQELGIKHKVDEAGIRVMQIAVSRLKTIGHFSVCLGALLMILGFLLWYLKLQRYIDSEFKGTK